MNGRSIAKAALAAGTALAGLGVASAALAQTDSEARAAPDEIIVTAQRRAEALEDVPMSIAVVDAKTLENSGVVSVTDLGQIASGVQINFGGAYTQPAVRGVTSLTTGASAENNVAIYVDGFYSPNNIAINADLANVESIQVLKGPQGALYGRNATGGAILINTLKPSEVLTGQLELTYARFDDKRMKGYLSGPLGDRIRASIAGYYRKTDGYLDFAPFPAGAPTANLPSDHPAGIEMRSIRTKLEMDLADTVVATVGYNYGYSDDTRSNLFTTYAYRPASVGTVAPPRDQVAYNYEQYNFAKSDELTLTVAVDSGLGKITSYTGYTWINQSNAYDFDGSYNEIQYAIGRYKQRTLQQTVDFAIDTVQNVSVILGISYFRDDLIGDPELGGTRTYNPGLTPGTMLAPKFRTEAIAVYADATWQIAPALSLNLGGRYTYEDRHASFFNRNLVTGAFTFAPTVRDFSFRKFTPRASVRYEFAPRANVYASYSNGFRSGTISSSGAPSPALWQPIKPEIIDAYEVGVKVNRAGLRFELAGFYYDYKDLHTTLSLENPACAGTPGCNLVSLFQNAPGGKIKGLDGSISASPVEGLNVRLNATYLHARYSTFRNAVGNGLSAATGLNVSGQIQDWTGKQMARAPELSGNLSLDYTLDLPIGAILIAGNARYSDSYVINNPSLFGPTAPAVLQNKQRYREGKMVLVNAQITWTDPSDHVWLGLFGTNLTNHKYRLTYSGGSFGDYGPLAEPRVYGVKAGYKF